MRLSVPVILALLVAPSAFAADPFVVRTVEVTDRKAVVATVEPAHQLVARARIGGTIASLTIKEGDTVAAGAQIALVTDQKLALQMQALDSRIGSQQSRRDQAKVDFDRVAELLKRGVSTQTQLDQAKTNLDVADRTLAAMQADRSVIAQQASEGAVLPRALAVSSPSRFPSARLFWPARRSRPSRKTNSSCAFSCPSATRDSCAPETTCSSARGAWKTDRRDHARGQGPARLPRDSGGRVIADVEVQGLGDYFVGERTRVYVDTGKRQTLIVPSSYVYRRAGVNYVRLAGGDEIVVQPGEPRQAGDAPGVEILAGLKDGDALVTP